jgi:hypothetical protein
MTSSLKREALPDSVIVASQGKRYAAVTVFSARSTAFSIVQYVNFVYGDDDEAVLHTAPVAADDAAYLERVIVALRPLSEEEYMTGPAVVLHTMAKSSYILRGEELFWCIEWQPGLIVVRMAPGQPMSWAAIRSPVPNFGGREASAAELDAYDENAENAQYNLIFTPWDAQFDAQDREWYSFVPAGEEVQLRFEKALARVNELGEIMEQRYSQDHDNWLARCKDNLRNWCGEGIRLA